MTEDTEHQSGNVFEDHRLIIFVLGSVVASVVLVMISFSLYVSSGASQLDLSRPGLADIRSEARSDDDFEGFPADGQLDEAALSQFNQLYTEKLKELQDVDAYKSDVLSPESLNID
ncbi:MAG TPA: hypothetical protein VGE34_03655 [Candidatus Saccharimonadales bacterium]